MPKLKLDIPLVNGCGIGSYLDLFELMEKKGACFGGYIPKSIGPFSDSEALRKKFGWEREKQGNPNPTVISTGAVELNSMALPSHPVEGWRGELAQTTLNVPIIVSIWGKEPEDYLRIADMVKQYFSALQINISCPNKQEGERSVMEEMTSQVEAIVKPVRDNVDLPLIVKLSPNEDYLAVANVVMPYVDYLCCGNTLGPGLVIDIHSKKPVLAGKDGGMSGAAIKPKTMKMVNDVYEAAKESDVGVWASGGIRNWEDIIEYAIAGASTFELGTEVFSKKAADGRLVGRPTDEVVQVTKDIWEGTQQYLRQNNTTLDNLVGSLEK